MSPWHKLAQRVIRRPEVPPKRNKAFWAMLILLDFLFILVFGWSLATKVYLHMNRPYAIPPPRFEEVKQNINPPAIPETPAPQPVLPKPEKKTPRPSPQSEESESAEKAHRTTFQYVSKTAKEVQLTGGFVGWKRKSMSFNSLKNTWNLTLYLKPGTYQYHFLADGKKILDPKNPLQQNDQSILVVPSD
ncbi:MAG: hypothetical protein HY400_07645 [Elusimicrobia bacterium]|nr:hypothetical protein [Elusimicrobiota bacterium]